MQSKIFLQCFQNYFYNCFTIFLHYFNNISTHYPLCRSSNIYPFHNHWMQMRSAFLGRKIENVEPNVPTFKKTIFLKIFLQYVNIIFTTFLHIICSNIYPFHNHNSIHFVRDTSNNILLVRTEIRQHTSVNYKIYSYTGFAYVRRT